MFLLLAATPALANQPFPDTGQTKCYNNTEEIPCPSPGQPFYGQDAQYQPRLPRSYTKLGHGGVELAADALHADDGGPWIMTRDNVTGLIWEIKTDANRNDTYTWQDAQDVFIAGLNSAGFGGFDDWRLPEVGELSSLVNAGVFEPAVDVDWFPNTQSSPYWSDTTSAFNTSYAWRVNFNNGYVGHLYDGSKSSSHYVRAVRAGQSWSFDNLIINGDGTVTDPDTGLMWQEETAPGTYEWQEALAYAENLTLAGYSDWRLPNRNELQSLIDYSRFNPAIKSALVGKTVSSGHWSAAPDASETYVAWLVNFGSGYVFVSNKPSSWYLRAVRAGHSNIGSFGSLVISIEPAEARVAGAQWRRSGNSTWWNSGAIETIIPTGTYTVEFKDVSGWNKPTSHSVIITDSETTIATGVYTVIQHTVTASAGSGGSVTPTSSTVNHGGTASFSVTPNTGYSHGAVSGTCPSGSFSGNTYTTGSITSACTVSFSFTQIQHTVTATAGTGGNVTPESRSVTHGETASFTVTANPGYTRDNTVGGACSAGSWNDNIYTTGSINNSCTVRFSFSQFHSAAVRAISGCSVCIVATPPAGTHTWAVEETIPNGLTVSGITDGGVFSAANRKINWGLFFGTASRTLCYEVSGVNGQYDVSGVISLDGVSNSITGSSRITLPCGNMTHPADSNSDWVLEINEATAYGAAWRRGDVWPIPPDPININYVTRAGYLWKNGGDYHRSDGFPPECWISGIGPSSITALYQAGSGGSTAIRSVAGDGGSTVVISIDATPEIGTDAYALEENIPPALLPANITWDGIWDAVNRKVKWGPFFDDTPRTLSYTLSGQAGAYSLYGVFSIDGVERTVGGVLNITIAGQKTPLPGVLMLLLED